MHKTLRGRTAKRERRNEEEEEEEERAASLSPADSRLTAFTTAPRADQSQPIKGKDGMEARFPRGNGFSRRRDAAVSLFPRHVSNKEGDFR